MDECPDAQLKCSNPKCGVPIPARLAAITEIFMGVGKPLCESCYEIRVIDDRRKSRKEQMEQWQKERTKQKTKKDSTGGHEDAGTQQNDE